MNGMSLTRLVRLNFGTIEYKHTHKRSELKAQVDI